VLCQVDQLLLYQTVMRVQYQGYWRSCTGDEIMADKGFLVQDILAPLGVRLNAPPLLKSNSQMAAEEVKRLHNYVYMLNVPLDESRNTVSCKVCYLLLCGTPSHVCVLHAQ